jgi:hypothetical protein
MESHGLDGDVARHQKRDAGDANSRPLDNRHVRRNEMLFPSFDGGCEKIGKIYRKANVCGGAPSI